MTEGSSEAIPVEIDCDYVCNFHFNIIFLFLFRKLTMLKRWSKRLKGSSSNWESQNVNEGDSMNHSASVFENILFYLYALKSSQSMFDQFTAAVEEDIKIKLNLLESTRLNMELSSNQRTFVNVQIMMLKRYSNRVKSLQTFLIIQFQRSATNTSKMREIMEQLVIL